LRDIGEGVPRLPVMWHRIWFAAGLGAGIVGWLALIAG
jgi:hypothetical protein